MYLTALETIRGNGTIAFLRILYHTRTVFDALKKSLLKSLWKKEKMLVTSIFSFFHNAFNPVKAD